MIVIDCSALTSVLTAHTATGEHIRRRVAQAPAIFAPALLDYEIQSALLGMRRGGKLTEREAEKAMGAYRLLSVEKRETLPLWDRVKTLYANLPTYDAQYVALVEALGVPLVTSDRRIERSGASRCPIETF